jgi:hypothetical protein
MSESPTPSDPMGGPISRPSGDGLPPSTGGGLQPPGSDDSVDPGLPGAGGDIGPDTSGLPGEG